MRLLKALAALFTALGMIWFLAPGAVAGGPTSVLLTSPESGETASLHHSDAEYAKLTALLGPAGTGGSKERPPSLDMAVGTRRLNVTWMIHDVQPWRVDRVYPGGEPGSVWIHTSLDAGAAQGTWHRAQRPAELTALLGRLGLMGEKSAAGSGGSGYPPAWEQDERHGSTADAAAPPTGKRKQPAVAPAARVNSAVTGWWWSIPGLAAGAALAVALRSHAPRMRRPPFGARGGSRDREPRQQLLDG